ncbi:hypothetical protein [Budvicia aquatica]|uniref:Uncharacterized protein n=1 Tax=Budvicia aquatica TaxID=82979 RepID=A0A2C6DPV2_9GAMM|nr:hypothetical protein [Budvicia aquatica]PHI31257.1 hypothetical protein CRN84_18890 [Budvicia aquatica]PHI31776.1 hypothetical protein CRN84_21815 [Budvicia aquatica]VFS51545.1 Uncharacterised protein [Budvicia aquatica]VFS52705.1 Uncharacterised protein [Budvicia aquatica]
MNLIARLLSLKSLENVDLIHTVRVTQSAFNVLTTLGSEGIFYPATQSSANAEYVILDLEFIRDHQLDFDKPALSEWCRTHLSLSMGRLQPLSYLFVVGTDDA